MSKRHKYINPDQLFENDINEDDAMKGNFRKRFPLRRQSHSNERGDELERQRQILIDRQIEIENRTLASAERTIGYIYTAEDIATSTVNELYDQGHKLKRVDKKLDDMKPTLQEGRKHIRGIYSIYSSFKNYFFRNDRPLKGETNMNNCTSEKFLTSCKFYTGDRYVEHSATRLLELDQNEQNEAQSRSERVDAALNAHLRNIENGIGRLKGIGRAMAEELEEQNRIIDIIHDKVDDTGVLISEQTKQIKKILSD